MLHLNKREQSESHLALLRIYGIEDRDFERPTPEKIRRIGFAELVSFAPSQIRRVQTIVNVLDRTRKLQEQKMKCARFFSVDHDLLSDLLKSAYLARLALHCAGYWCCHNTETGESEWGDCGMIGGARSELILSDALCKMAPSENCAA